jgi:hypothetical protein
MVGAHGRLLFWLHPSWAPPATAPVVVAALTLGYAAFIAHLFTLRPASGEVPVAEMRQVPPTRRSAPTVPERRASVAKP